MEGAKSRSQVEKEIPSLRASRVARMISPSGKLALMGKPALTFGVHCSASLVRWSLLLASCDCKVPDQCCSTDYEAS